MPQIAARQGNEFVFHTDPVEQLVTTIKNATNALKSYGARQTTIETLTGELADLRLEQRLMEDQPCIVLKFPKKSASSA